MRTKRWRLRSGPGNRLRHSPISCTFSNPFLLVDGSRSTRALGLGATRPTVRRNKLTFCQSRTEARSRIKPAASVIEPRHQTGLVETKGENKVSTFDPTLRFLTSAGANSRSFV